MPEEAPSGRGGVRGHRPSDRSVRPGLVAAPALLNALIHRSAWKEYSRKFAGTILYIRSPIGPETVASTGPKRSSQYYMLWCWMDIRSCECSSGSDYDI